MLRGLFFVLIASAICLMLQGRYDQYTQTPKATLHLHNFSKLGLQNLEIHAQGRIKRYTHLEEKDWYLNRFLSYETVKYRVLIDIFQRQPSWLDLEIKPGENHVITIHDDQIELERNALTD